MSQIILKNPKTNYRFYYCKVDPQDKFKPKDSEYIHAIIDHNGHDYVGYSTQEELNNILEILYKENWIEIESNNFNTKLTQ